MRAVHEHTTRGQLDPAGRFRIREADGVPVFTFGKFRLLPVRDHLDYLAWVVRQDFPPSTLRVGRELLQNGGNRATP